MSANPLVDPARGSQVVVELGRAAVEVLLDALASTGSASLLLEVEPSARPTPDGTVDADVKVKRAGRWSPPIAVVGVRVEPLYDAP